MKMSGRSVRRGREARVAMAAAEAAAAGETATVENDGAEVMLGVRLGPEGGVDDADDGEVMLGGSSLPVAAGGNFAVVGTRGVRRGVNGDGELGDVLRHLPAFMSTNELAGLTGMHVGSIRRGIAEGRIPADKVNGRWVIPAAFLLRNSYRCMDGVAAADEAAAEALEAMREMRDAEVDAAETEVLRAEKALQAAERRAEKAHARASLARRARDGRRRDGGEGMGGALCRV